MLDRAFRSFLRLLCSLRWLAVLGQALTVWLVSGPMGLPLPTTALWSAIGCLAIFNLYAEWRVRRTSEPLASEAFVHLLVDIGVLTWLIAWSGGIENPFSSLFLLPIAVAIVALSSRWIWATAVASVTGYVVSALLASPLPHLHGGLGGTFELHKVGMLVNFAVSAIVVLAFSTRMLAIRRRSEHEIAILRERFTRNEGILALATHAASVAHELNTPLGSLTLMVDDLLSDATSPQQREDLQTIKALLEVCSGKVRELAAPAEAGDDSRPAAHIELERVIERWQLVRPTIELHRSESVASVGKVDPAVGHLVQALLNNAADASEQAGHSRVDLTLHMEGNALRGEIRDYGLGFERGEPPLPSKLYRTNKASGMGIGLALSHATVERLGGELSMREMEQQGVCVSFNLPKVTAT